MATSAGGGPLSLKRVLLLLIGSHLTILFLQLPIRQLVFDSTFWRDALLLVTLATWGAAMLMRPGRFRLSGLDALVLAMVGYGTLLTLIGSLTDGNAADQLLDFRNYFLPWLIYFPARLAFAVPRHRLTYVRYLMVFFVVFLASPALEWLYSLSNLPMEWIPWYSYTFSHDNRFLGNSDSAYIDPANSPILGLLGYPHYTAPVLVALFAFLIPLLSYRLPVPAGGREKALTAFSRLPQGVYTLLLGIVVVMLRVRTQIVTALVVLFVVPSGGRALKFGLYAAAAVGATILWFPEQAMEVGQSFAAGVVRSDGNASSLDLILSVREVLFVASSPIKQLLFGHGPGFDAAASGQWELRLLYFTARLGVVWVLLFGGVVAGVFRGILRIRETYAKSALEFRVAQGVFGMTAVYLLDSGHYMRLMTWPNLDLWIISISLISAVLDDSAGRWEIAPVQPGGSPGPALACYAGAKVSGHVEPMLNSSLTH